MGEKVTLIAALFIHPGREAEFEEFETAATRIMQRYGGGIERRIRISGADEKAPYEVHLVSFPDDAAFQRYRNDGELKALGELRARAIRETVVWVGREMGGFLK